MDEIATKIAFGSEKRLDQAIERGDIDAFDLLLLEERKIGWIDENGNKVIIDGTKQILFVDALPDVGSANTIYFQNGVLYYWDGNTFIPHVGSDGINQAILDSKIEDAKNTISAHTDKLIENVNNQMNEDIADKISYNEQTLTEEQKEQTRKNIGIVQADYAQNDETAADYIKNRLAWTEKTSDVLGELVLDSVCRSHILGEGFHFLKSDTFEEKIGSLYRITIDKYVFYAACKSYRDETYIGDLSYLNSFDSYFSAVSTGEKILIINNMYEGEINGDDYYFAQIIIPDVFKFDESQSTISITIQEVLEKGEETVHQIDPKYYERLAWEEKEEKVIFNQRVTPDADTGEVVFMPSVLNLEVGKAYTVKFDNDVYETVAFEIDAEGVKAVCLGSAPLGFGDPSSTIDPPFFIASKFQVESNLFADMVCYLDLTNPDEPAIVTDEYDLCIIEHAETIHKIDPKFYDRLAWEEKGASVQICPPTEFSDWEEQQLPNGNIAYFTSVFADNVPFKFVDGRTYTVVLDGTPYEVVASSTSIQNTEMDEALKAVILGNADIFPISLGVVASSNEPFFIVQAEDVLMCGVTSPGDHTFEIYETAQVIHKIDPKFLPDNTADMAVNDMFSAGFVKNRPSYNGVIDVNIKDAIAAGACCIDFYGLRYVRISEYFEPDEKILNTIMSTYLGGFPLSVYGCALYYDHDSFFTWSVSDIDIKYYLGISADKALENEALPDELSMFRNIEPGVYVLVDDSITSVRMTIEKRLDYNDLNNLPFGYVPERIFEFTEIWFDEDNNAMIEKYDSDGQCIESSTYYLKFGKGFSYEKLIGRTLYLSDGTSVKISSEELRRLPTSEGCNEDGTHFIFKDLVVFTYSSAPADIEVPLSEYSLTYIGSHKPLELSGVYVNRDPSGGVYVTGITLEDTYIKSIDTKYLPDSIAITDEELDALNASII